MIRLPQSSLNWRMARIEAGAGLEKPKDQAGWLRQLRRQEQSSTRVRDPLQASRAVMKLKKQRSRQGRTP